MEKAKQLTCSIGMASGMFGLSDSEFTRLYIKRGIITPDRLHQLDFRKVRHVYEHTVEQQERLSKSLWHLKHDHTPQDVVTEYLRIENLKNRLSLLP